MKKSLKIASVLLAFTMIAGSFAGCSDNSASTGNQTSQTGTSSEKPKEVFVKIATGNTGGAYYPVGVSMVNCGQKKFRA